MLSNILPMDNLLIRILFILRNARDQFDEYKIIYYYLDAKLNRYYSKLVLCVVPRMQHIFFIFSNFIIKFLQKNKIFFNLRLVFLKNMDVYTIEG